MQDIQLFNGSRQPHSVEAPDLARPNEKCQILAKKGFLTARKLTSEVALLVYSQEFQLGVLLHLPPFHSPDGADVNADAFAKTALTMILGEFEALGVAKGDLLTYAVGGSTTEAMPGVSNTQVRRTLWNYGLVLSACDLGGSQTRSIWMDVQTGRTIIRSESTPAKAANREPTVAVAS